jgi:hypothetical protein
MSKFNDPGAHTAADFGRTVVGRNANRILAALIVGLFALDGLTHDLPLVLPALSVVLTLAGIVWATGLALAGRGSGQQLTDRLAGPALVLFFGFAAATLSDADKLVPYLTALH